MKPSTHLRTLAGTPKGSTEGVAGLAPKLRESFVDRPMHRQTLLLYNIDS